MIKLKVIIKDLDGEILKENNKDMTIGNSVAKILSSTASPDPLRAYLLAVKFHTDEEIELNQSDKDFVTDMVKKSNGWPLLIGQLLSTLNS